MTNPRGRIVVRTVLQALSLLALVVAFLTVIGAVTWSIRQPATAELIWSAVIVAGSAVLVAAGAWFAAVKLRVD